MALRAVNLEELRKRRLVIREGELPAAFPDQVDARSIVDLAKLIVTRKAPTVHGHRGRAAVDPDVVCPDRRCMRGLFTEAIEFPERRMAAAASICFLDAPKMLARESADGHVVPCPESAKELHSCRSRGIAECRRRRHSSHEERKECERCAQSEGGEAHAAIGDMHSGDARTYGRADTSRRRMNSNAGKDFDAEAHADAPVSRCRR